MTSYVICSGCVSSTNSMLLALAKNGGGSNDAAVSVKVLDLTDFTQLWDIVGARIIHPLVISDLQMLLPAKS